MREERDDNPFSWYRWQYDSAGRLLVQDGTLPGQEQWRWDAAGNPLEGSAEKVTHNHLTQLNGIRWRYDIHGRTVEKDNGQTRWHYRYDGEHRLTEVISQPRDRNKPQTQVSFRYDPLGRRISKTRRQMLGGQPTGKPVTTRFVWEGFRLLQEVHGDVPLTYVYSDQDSYDPLARIDGVNAPEIFWFHCQPNGTPERMTDSEGQVRWEGVNSAWGKLLRESETQVSGYSQNLRMQGQYLDRETGLHYNLFRYYDPDCGRFTQQDPIGLYGGLNLYSYAPNPLGWIDPLGLCKRGDPYATESIFRVQGGTPPNASRVRIKLDSANNPKIQRGTLNISIGDSSHAQHFLDIRGGNAEIVSFKVPKWMADFIEESAIPQAGYRTNPLNQGGLAPKRVDPTTPGRSYELPSIWAEWLEEVAIPGSGNVK
ncbi:type IV secretion protein Rhs [Enterobacter asburiae]|nr:type IV secretion protein Rhs [Enterobacter asburiae]